MLFHLSIFRTSGQALNIPPGFFRVNHFESDRVGSFKLGVTRKIYSLPNVLHRVSLKISLISNKKSQNVMNWSFKKFIDFKFKGEVVHGG